jgi:hypothetical protein
MREKQKLGTPAVSLSHVKGQAKNDATRSFNSQPRRCSCRRVQQDDRQRRKACCGFDRQLAPHGELAMLFRPKSLQSFGRLLCFAPMHLRLSAGIGASILTRRTKARETSQVLKQCDQATRGSGMVDVTTITIRNFKSYFRDELGLSAPK